MSKYSNKWAVGEIIGNWTVCDREVKFEAGQHYAKILCQCACGSQPRLVDAFNLSRGVSTKCRDCGNSPEAHLGNKNGNWRGYNDLPGSLINRIKSRANQMEVKYNLTPKYLWNLLQHQANLCALTNLPIAFIDKSASLDRIESNKGYVRGNVQWVHKNANIMKNGYSLDYFVSMCHAVANTLPNPNINLDSDSYVYGFNNKKKVK